MHHIKKLDSLTIAKIAAGEVVDRPVSVIKELVENSIDAGATLIQLSIQKGGLELIQVMDNGSGILASELPLALEAHATSKIDRLDDLFSTKTMGFRGEALASIRHVARVQIKSNVAGSQVGAQIEGYGDTVTSVTRVAHPVGTTVSVRDLFRNIPVRQKFLKSPATEFSYINDLIVGLSLHYVSINFVLIHDQKEILNTRGLHHFDDRIAVIWGKSLHGKLLPVKFSLAEYVVTGNISNPTVTFSSRNRQVITVNGRLVKNPVLQKALTQASADAIPAGRFLAVVIDIQVPEGQVDINIHPQKLDVRFASSGFVFDILVKAIRLALSGVRGPVMMSENRVSGGEIRYQAPNLQAVSQQTDVLFQAIEWNKPQMVETVPILNAPAVSYIQMFDTYLLVSAGSSLLIMDQHAVHERILYEQIKARSEETLYSQPLLAAEVILLTADQYSRFWESAEFFREIGFEIDDFGANQIIVRQVPVSLGGPAPERLVVGMLDSFFENPDLHWDRLMHDKDRLQRMACRAAIKAGKRMAKEEVFAMIDALIKTPGNYTCPHGRPLFLTWTKSDFEKMFLRT